MDAIWSLVIACLCIMDHRSGNWGNARLQIKAALDVVNVIEHKNVDVGGPHSCVVSLLAQWFTCWRECDANFPGWQWTTQVRLPQVHTQPNPGEAPLCSHPTQPR